jgi:hypothetical protein
VPPELVNSGLPGMPPFHPGLGRFIMVPPELLGGGVPRGPSAALGLGMQPRWRPVNAPMPDLTGSGVYTPLG